MVKTSSTAKHAFLYLTSFLTLAFVAYSVGALFFEIINYYFPEEVESWQNTFSQGRLKFSIAALIITAPVYFYVNRLINKDLVSKKLNFGSGVRKWLTYIALFIATGFILGDLISTIFHFLDGELTVRFFLKALTVLIISGAILLYYFTDIKSNSPRSKNKLWGIIFWIFVLIPFISAFCLIESPKIARMKKIDLQTVETLDNLHKRIKDYVRGKEKLPDKYEELKKLEGEPTERGYTKKMVEKYNIRYRKTSPLRYQLCAEFQRDNRKDQENKKQHYYLSGWLHGSGNHCFDLKIDPKIDFEKEERRAQTRIY